jgi:hypothetical protein
MAFGPLGLVCSSAAFVHEFWFPIVCFVAHGFVCFSYFCYAQA